LLFTNTGRRIGGARADDEQRDGQGDEDDAAGIAG